MSANEVAAAALLAVFAGFIIISAIGWAMTKPRKNRYNKRGRE